MGNRKLAFQRGLYMATALTQENIREENGIVFLVKPLKILYSDWIFDHLDCDTVILDDPTHSDDITVLCFAKSKEYNKELRRVRNAKFPNDKIMRGFDSREVSGID